MNYYFITAIVLLILSNAITAFLLYKSKKRFKEQKPTLELQDFLHDLTRGEALLKISLLNAEEFHFIKRSPKYGRK